MTRRGRGLAALIGAGTVGVLFGAACSLDLDEALIDRRPDAGGLEDAFHPSADGAADAADATDASDASDAADSGSPAPVVSTCENDDGCKTTNGCLKGRCDVARKSCIFDVCRPMACNAAACDTNTSTCGAPAPYKYAVTQFSLGQNAFGSATAVYPWLFILTPTGLVVYNVANVASGTPPRVPVVGLDFVPVQMVLSGSRIWFRAGASGPVTSRFPVAYVDVPSDPFATTMSARSVLASYDRPATDAAALLSRGDGSALLIGPASTKHPSTIIEAPLTEPFALTGTPLPVSPETGPVTTSGKRLLMSNGAANSYYFIDNAGTKAPAAGLATAVAGTGSVSASRRFVHSTDGAVFFGFGVSVASPVLPPPALITRAARGHFLTANGTAPIDANLGVDIEVYDAPENPVGANAGVIGPMAMLDAKTVMVSVVARESATATAVEFVTREPVSVIKDVDALPRRVLLPIPIGRIAAAAASNGIGYLIANDKDGPPAAGTVYVFDPGCPR